MVVLDRAPTDTDRAYDFAFGVLQGNSSREGNQPVVAVLDSV